MSWFRDVTPWLVGDPAISTAVTAKRQFDKSRNAVTQPGDTSSKLGSATAAPQARTYSNSNVLQRTGPDAYGTVQNNLLRRVQGKTSPGLADKFSQMDNATATGSAQARQDAIRPGMFGQGMASRGVQRVQQDNMARISDDKLKQAQMLGQDAQSAEQTITSNRNADRDFSYKAASDLGDTVTQAGIAKQALGDNGLSYTGYGEKALEGQANSQATSSAKAQDAQDRLLTMQEKQLERSLQNGADSSSGKWWQRMGQYASMLAG